jgi:hypothetical protein
MMKTMFSYRRGNSGAPLNDLTVRQCDGLIFVVLAYATREVQKFMDQEEFVHLRKRQAF